MSKVKDCDVHGPNRPLYGVACSSASVRPEPRDRKGYESSIFTRLPNLDEALPKKIDATPPPPSKEALEDENLTRKGDLRALINELERLRNSCNINIEPLIRLSGYCKDKRFNISNPEDGCRSVRKIVVEWNDREPFLVKLIKDYTHSVEKFDDHPSSVIDEFLDTSKKGKVTIHDVIGMAHANLEAINEMVQKFKSHIQRGDKQFKFVDPDRRGELRKKSRRKRRKSRQTR